MWFKRLPLLAWTGLIVLAVVPWLTFRDHSHVEKIGWIPFVTPPVMVGDILRNALLYLPFGYLYAAEAPRAGAIRAVLLAAALSLVTETTQVFSHGRFPSSTDVCCNVFGAWVGFQWQRARGRRAWRAVRPAPAGAEQ